VGPERPTRLAAAENRSGALSEKAICRYMEMITLEKLRDWKYVVAVPPEVAERARGAIAPPPFLETRLVAAMRHTEPKGARELYRKLVREIAERPRPGSG